MNFFFTVIEIKYFLIFQYLGLRFGKRIRLVASLAYTLQMVLYIGIVIYAPAITLEAVTGLSKTFSILLIGSNLNPYLNLSSDDGYDLAIYRFQDWCALFIPPSVV